MRRLIPTCLVALFIVSSAAAAQTRRIILVPEITYSMKHEVYRGLVYARIFSVGTYFQGGWIELSPGVRYGLRGEVLSGTRSWGAFVAYSTRQAEVRSGGDQPQASFRMAQSAEFQLFTLGVVRQLPLGAPLRPLPASELRIGLAALVMKISAERNAPPLNWLQVPDFVSPGGQLSLGVVQRITGRFDVRSQVGYTLVRHDAEGIDGGGLPGSEPSLGQWASAFDVGLGMGVSF